jgi:hypothetical protein
LAPYPPDAPVQFAGVQSRPKFDLFLGQRQLDRVPPHPVARLL